MSITAPPPPHPTPQSSVSTHFVSHINSMFFQIGAVIWIFFYYDIVLFQN